MSAHAAAPVADDGVMSFGAATRIYRDYTWLRLRRGRLWWLAAALLVLPLPATVALALAGHWGRGLFDDMAELYLRFLLPFVPALVASSLIGDEIDRKTVTYLFARPAPRGALVVGKLLGAVVPLMLVTLPTLGLVWLVSLVRFPADFADNWMHLVRVAAAALLGLGAYGALALLGGALFNRHSFVATAGYLLLVEAGLGSTPIVLNRLALSWHLRNLGDLPLPNTLLVALPLPPLASGVLLALAAALLASLAALSLRGVEARG